jgi:protein ImuB
MSKRYMSIWFPHLITDWHTRRCPELQGRPIVITAKDHGRLVITATNTEAEQQGISPGMAAADAKAIVAGLQVIDEIPTKAAQLLNAIGEWCIRFTPVVAVDMPDGLILDITGCPHLWNGEEAYLNDITVKLRDRGYDIRAAIADTIGLAWGTARFGAKATIIAPYCQATALLPLPPEALRLDPIIVARLKKVGFRKIENFIGIKHSALRRRFGETLLQRISQALGTEKEMIMPLRPIAPYEERLPCLDPIRTAPGIEIALQKLLDTLCNRLQNEEKGLRAAVLKCYRVDHKVTQIEIGTKCATRNIQHLLKLFELKIPMIEPALGIELFTLEATNVEDVTAEQESIWAAENSGLESTEVAELLDRITGKIPSASIRRYLPQEHYWPERSIKATSLLTEKATTEWLCEQPRPTQLLHKPEPIIVTVPVPDYPPMLFIYKGNLHNIKKADGPERIEREWWLEDGELRDYYAVEDEQGQRYWLFRSGYYSGEKTGQWFIHGFFA